jgi:hypothetical protein
VTTASAAGAAVEAGRGSVPRHIGFIWLALLNAPVQTPKRPIECGTPSPVKVIDALYRCTAVRCSWLKSDPGHSELSQE